MPLLEIELPGPGTEFPLTLPLLSRTRRLKLDAQVTVLAGENGSGKSTLLEALALACELPVAGASQSVASDATLAHVEPLADAMKLTWTHRSQRGFFLRAEDFFGFVQAQNRMKDSLRRQVEELRREDPTRPEAELRRISAPFTGSLDATEARYGGDLDARSHGESFLAFFRGRLRSAGLYLLDEPEAALSPLRQLAFISLVKQAVANGGQFVIATHSPILMAFPGARLYEIRDGRVAATDFEELEHVKLLREFLEAPEAFLRHL